MNTSRRTALVTGASSGIGFELAKVLAREGLDLVLVARSGAPMHELADEVEERYGVTATVLPKDLAKLEAAREVAFELDARNLAIDVLVNSAGFSQYARFASSDERHMLELLQVNMVALTHLTRLIVPGMVDRGRGTIVNLASNAAFQPGPLMACYYASKAYVLSFSVALAEELDGTGVTVTALCPGPFASGFQARADMQDSKIVSGRSLRSAVDVAEWGWAQAKAGRPFAVNTPKWRAIAFATRFLPRSFAARWAMQAQERVSE